MLVARILLAHRRLALLLCAATLLLKLLVPVGYMVTSHDGRLTVSVCSGLAPATMSMAMPGMHGQMPDHGKPTDKGGAEMPCAYAGFASAVLSATDAVLLAALIAFVIAAGVLGRVLPPPSSPARLRPPLRGPPILP